MFPQDILDEAQGVIAECAAAGLRLATAESCTGGLIGGCLTAIPGSSAVFDRGFEVYSAEAKFDVLGVSLALIKDKGSVSEEVARAMAEGALARSPVDIVVAVTGVSGPGGGSSDRPVGTVFFATARRGAETQAQRRQFDGDRHTVQLATAKAALALIKARVAG